MDGTLVEDRKRIHMQLRHFFHALLRAFFLRYLKTLDTKYRQTPLQWAAKNGHDLIVRMLLARNAVNLDEVDQ